MKEDIAKILLKTEAVLLRPEEPFTYASGSKGPIYCDNRLLLSHPKERKAIVKAFLKLLEPLDFDVVAGTATSGIPWASWIAAALEKPMIYVRSKPKGHGKENLIEGKLKEGNKVIVIEDIFNSGGSSIKAVEGVRAAGGIVTDCVAIVTYEHETCRKGFETIDCRTGTLTTFTTLLTVANEKGEISEKEQELLLDWHQDPGNWEAPQ